MVFFALLIILICTFILFTLARHDFVLIRQNISTRLVFDRALVILIVSLFIARAFYLIDEGLYSFFLSPLQFLHVVINWGFNYFGLFLSMFLMVILYFRRRKNVLRISDVYLLSFYPISLLDSIYFFKEQSVNFLLVAAYLAIVLVLFFIFTKLHSSPKIRDGAVSFLILTASSISYLLFSFFAEGRIGFFSPVQIVALAAIALFVYALFLTKLNFFAER